MRILKTWGFSILPLTPVKTTRAISRLPIANPFPFLENGSIVPKHPMIFEKTLDKVANKLKGSK